MQILLSLFSSLTYHILKSGCPPHELNRNYVEERMCIMIQDIAPHNLDIVYRDELPNSKSRIIFMSENKIYVKENNAEIDFPMYIDTNLFGHDIQYLFFSYQPSRCIAVRATKVSSFGLLTRSSWRVFQVPSPAAYKVCNCSIFLI